MSFSVRAAVSEAEDTSSEADSDLRNRLAIRDRRKGRRLISGLGGNSEVNAAVDLVGAVALK